MTRTALALAGTLLLALTACGGGSTDTASGTPSATAAAGGYEAVLAEAKGQTVDWYMYGGDDQPQRLRQRLRQGRAGQGRASRSTRSRSTTPPRR